MGVVYRSRRRTLRFPEGLLFHIAPGNADTVFVYSWALAALAALAGNRNAVRVSERGGAATEAVLSALAQSLDQADPVVAGTQRIVSYDHLDEAATAELSAACDLRVLWGSDQAITDIRRSPLRPSARDLTFPNRVEAFHSDTYLFGQAACASPGMIFWIGAARVVAAARVAFEVLLTQTVDARGPRADAAMAIQKHATHRKPQQACHENRRSERRPHRKHSPNM